jgi:hypothetical protein
MLVQYVVNLLMIRYLEKVLGVFLFCLEVLALLMILRRDHLYLLHCIRCFITMRYGDSSYASNCSMIVCQLSLG